MAAERSTLRMGGGSCTAQRSGSGQLAQRTLAGGSTRCGLWLAGDAKDPARHHRVVGSPGRRSAGGPAASLKRAAHRTLWPFPDRPSAGPGFGTGVCIPLMFLCADHCCQRCLTRRGQLRHFRFALLARCRCMLRLRNDAGLIAQRRRLDTPPLRDWARYGVNPNKIGQPCCAWGELPAHGGGQQKQ